MTKERERKEQPAAAPVEARQGLRVDAADPGAIAAALDLAFDYRGDVTITLRTSGARVEGYLFDRRRPAAGRGGAVRVIPSDGSPRITIADAEIEAIEFTGRDTAAGKSFETWVRKYIERKRQGRPANIECEPLNDHD